MTKLNRLDPNLLQHNPRCGAAAWERYRSLVVAAYRFHPRAYIYKPNNMTPATIASRLRDAVRGAIAFQYNIESDITGEDLSRWWGEVVVKHTKDSVHIGPPNIVRESLSGEDNTTNNGAMQYSSLSFEEVSAFCLLLSTGRLTGPILITLPPDLSTMAERPNVEMVEKQDGSLMLL